MKKITTIALCLFVSFILMLCVITTEHSFASNSKLEEIRVGDSRGDWGLPNPYQHYPRGPGYIRASWVFDTLIWKDQNGDIPALAQSWSYDPATMSYTFKLNPKAKWHDGKPVTAADIAFTVEYYKKYHYSWVNTESISKVVASDAQTVVITLAEPYAPFLANIGGTMPILPKHIWENVSDPKNFTAPEAFIGSGPYKFKDFNKTHGSYLYEAYNDYYQGRPLADRLIYVRVGKLLPALLNKEVDTAIIQPDMAEQLEKRGLVVIKDENGWNKKLMINHKKVPFNNKIFRQALAYAINQQEIIDKANRGFGVPASYGLLTIDHDMYNPNTPKYPHDTQKARQMLESLGYVKGPDGFYSKDGRPLQLELFASNVTVGGQSAPDRDGEVLKKQFEDAGIRIVLLPMEQATADARVKNWQFDLAVSGHGGLSGDPAGLNQNILPDEGGSSVNSARFGDNAELTRLLREQLKEMDVAKRKEIIFKIQEIYADEMPAISLYYPDSKAAYNPEKAVWFYTKGGISGRGVPVSQNKMALIPR